MVAMYQYVTLLIISARSLQDHVCHKRDVNAPLHCGVTRVRIRCIVQGLVWLDVLHLVFMLVMLALYLMNYSFCQTLIHMFLVHI